MRIKRLELVGFKSCMERTVLEFPSGITGIVGPNGCGKSNIVDALRWVLGEQSAKHLRGRAMEDVIFSGNQANGPLGAAEVTIVLDNDPNQEFEPELDAEDSEVVKALRRAPELQVTRRLYRSGESEYLINARPCRLRDITELFLGTGVGTKAYSMIEQGRVGQVVNAKPEDLRLFIEEAAGTTLYRSRKVAAERKIERTRDNLARVTDIVRELERQARSLRRQANGAVRFQELKAEEEELDRTLSGHRLAALDLRARELSERLAEVTGRELALRLRGEGSSRRRDRVREMRREIESSLEDTRNDLYRRKGQLAELEQERRFLQSRVLELEKSLGEVRTEAAELELKQASCAAERAELESERQSVAKTGADSASQRSALEGEFGILESAYMAWSAENEAVKTEIIQRLADQASLKNERSALNRQLAGIDEKMSRLREESTALETVAQRLREDIATAQTKLDEVIEALGRTEGGKRTTAAALSAALSGKAEVQRRVDAAQEEVSVLKSRLESLQELHESFAGYGDGVRQFMSNGGREKTGASAVVADVIDIESGFERAAAAVLQERLQYVVVPDSSAGVAGAEYLKDTGCGRASFIPMQPRRYGSAPNVPPGYSLLSEHLSVREGYQSVVEPLVAGVVVADSLDQACRQWERNGYHATFVTRSGEVVDPSGIVTGGSGQAGDEGILARKAEIRRLSISLAEAKAKHGEARAALDRATSEADRSSRELADLDLRLHELTVERVAMEGELELKRHNLSRTEERCRAVEAERAALGQEAGEHRGRVDVINTELIAAEKSSAEFEGRRAELNDRGAGFDSRRAELRSAIEALRVREAELRQKEEGCVGKARALDAAAQDLATRLSGLSARAARDQAALDEGEARLDAPELDLEEARREVAQREEALARIEEESRDLTGQLEALERESSARAARAEALRGDRGALEVKATETSLERDSLAEAVGSRLGLSLEDLRTATDGQSSEIDVGGLKSRLAEVRDRIRRLGMVNLGAIVELEEIEKRLSELGGQRDDLERSIEDLRGTIARLNRHSRKRFKETFDVVNGIFQETFPKLFRGGKASLSLTDENNLLETGVEIFVQPPGKKLGNLNLLSGGEKALTAISLIFSLFMHKPSPFCVLDEVDAPLDEANVGRFITMVREMSARSQFVLITHNKRTMEHCGTLYGVTMPEPGVSRIVSVNL